MTKQEEIREGMENVIRGYEGAERWSGVITDGLLGYLHSQGVVIKVDRELPDMPCYSHTREKTAYSRSQEDMLNAGYVAVEPLIKEK